MKPEKNIMGLHLLFIAKAYKNSFNEVSGIFVREQAKAIAMQGVRTGLLAVNFVSWRDILKKPKIDFGFRHFDQDGIEAYVYQTPVWPWFRWINYKRRDLLLKRLSERYLSEFGKPDVVHLHGFYCGMEALRLKKTHGIPFITTEHYSVFNQKMTNRFEEKIAARTYAESAHRIAVSHSFKKYLAEKFGLPFHYLPNITDTTKFSIQPLRQRSPQKTLLSVGKINKNKNQTLLFKAFSLLTDTNIQLIVVGTGPSLPELTKLASELNILHRVKFAGYVPNELLVTYYHKADLLVIPSIYETFGIVMIEALSCGIRVVSTPVGAASEILTDQRVGMICEPNPTSMASCIMRLLNEEPDPEFIHAFAASRFSSEKISEELIAIYQTVSYGSD
jgi:glycosyltransferase involved in cell wall biosynthesis